MNVIGSRVSAARRPLAAPATASPSTMITKRAYRSASESVTWKAVSSTFRCSAIHTVIPKLESSATATHSHQRTSSGVKAETTSIAMAASRLARYSPVTF